MRRFVTIVVSAAMLSLIGIVQPSMASAASSMGVSQPPAAVEGQPYSYQLRDAAHGPVTGWVYAYDCPTPTGSTPNPNLVNGLPSGLSMNPTALITGTPNFPEQAQFCALFTFADGSHEIAVVTMTVGTGNPTLDPVVIPAGTQVAIEEAALTQLPTQLENFIGILVAQPACLLYSLEGAVGIYNFGPPPKFCIV